MMGALVINRIITPSNGLRPYTLVYIAGFISPLQLELWDPTEITGFQLVL